MKHSYRMAAMSLFLLFLGSFSNAQAQTTAPQGLTAAPQWVVNCPQCNMPMAHVILTWQSVATATGYNVYRDGTLLGSVTDPTYTDMAVTSGQTYAYAVSAVVAGSESAQSAGVTATAPNPPSTLPAPTNLAVHGFWQGGSSDILTWDPVPGAIGYTVYQYDLPMAKNVAGIWYMVPLKQFWNGVTYTVTAVDGMGMESLPSNIATAAGASNPAKQPSWMPALPAVPSHLTATAEWNAGAPRVRLTWTGSSTDYTYNIYRDGQQIATGLWGLAYSDTTVLPGETHAYAVTGVNVPWTTPMESGLSAVVTATAPIAAPTPLAATVQITNIIANDDSAQVFFKPVPGAVDYRITNLAKPGTVKYAGRIAAVQSGDMAKNHIAPLPPPSVISIEMNGLDPVNGADLVVEAVDKLGPFQKMDGMMGPGAMQMDGSTNSAINGQGDPSNVPNVLATSGAFHVTCQPTTLTGSQVFFDNFRGSAPFTPVAALDPAIAKLSTSYSEISEIENDKWRIRTYGADTNMTKSFVMSTHFMDTLYDGPTAMKMPFSHNNNSSLVMMPKATADLFNGGVLHVTFEVDAHFDSRRWCDVFISEAGDPLLRAAPTKLGTTELPTVKGNLLVWQIDGGTHSLQLIEPQTQADGSVKHVNIDLIQAQNYNDGFTLNRGIYQQVYKHIPYANGSAANLDKRSRFDLYLSQNHYKIVETEADGVTKIVREKDFPAGVTLPFTNAQVYFVHELYHTGNDRPEQEGEVDSSYWVNYRPWSDERHWDNMGFEVISSFPQ